MSRTNIATSQSFTIHPNKVDAPQCQMFCIPSWSVQDHPSETQKRANVHQSQWEVPCCLNLWDGLGRMMTQLHRFGKSRMAMETSFHWSQRWLRPCRGCLNNTLIPPTALKYLNRGIPDNIFHVLIWID